MSGIKVGDKVACFIEDRMVVCTVTVVEGACCTVMDGLGQKRNRTIARCLTVEQVVSLAEEMVGVPTPEKKPKDIVYVTSYDTGTNYTVGQAVEVMCRLPNGAIETVDGYRLVPGWYTEEKPF